MTLWAIQHTTPRGSTWLDHTTVRMTRGETWRAYYASHAGATPKWHAEIKRRRRAGRIRAVKVQLTQETL
jgi:hypothetical protein